ncbi:MAG: hypothetical protein JSR97_06515 [Verrucomicrobia bacterium]|nr:hypothetical protein [Verrucomicrobiota bacterium]
MNKLDRIISALYLAKSDNREKMLADLVQNILYSVNEPVDIDTLIKYIVDNFHLEPIKYEIQESIDFLISEGDVCTREKKYCLEDKAYAKIHSIVLKGQGESGKRFETFNHIVKDIFDGAVTEEEIKTLWTVFNEYLMECFMVFGRKAIDIFLPYKQDELNEDDDIFKESYLKLKADKLITIFKKLVVEYPDRLTEAELRYLTGLATRAERFYSLGVEKEEYLKIKNLQIKDLVVLVDTNILYSVLNLRVHQENAAIFELIRIAKEKQIDLRLVYLPKTYTELQKVKSYLDKIISKDNFRVPQIKALLASDRLDSFARKFYENKLKNSDLPHPSEKVTYASDFFKSQGIIIYNNRFPKLEDDTEFINKQIIEYVDFQRYYNNLCDEKGYDFHLNKDDKKIEHDVFLREGVKILKSKFSDENELRFICLTLDRSLIHFDHYSLRNESKGTHKVINPNFIQPSQFIKKIRPFIPISTNNYRKAFISSLTAPNFEKDDDKGTILIQKTMTYFKNLGIDDEEVILNCIKRELFLEELVKHEKDNTTEEFIKTEIAKEIDRIKEEKEKLEKDILSQEKRTEKLIEIKEKEKKEILKEKETAVIKLESKVSNKDERIQQLEDKLTSFEKERELEKEERKKEKAFANFEKTLSQWNANKEEYISKQLSSDIPTFRKHTLYFTYVLLITICPIVVGFILKANEQIIAKIESYGINQWYVWCGLTLVFIVELFGRAYLFNKEKVKNGWEWFVAFFKKSKYKSIMDTRRKVHEEDYINKNGQKPQYDESTNA